MSQVQYTPITGNQAVLRDLNLYPVTTEGEAALFNAIVNNKLPKINHPNIGVEVGTTLSELTITGTDYNNIPFTTSRAVQLLGTTVRQQPRLMGNYYLFTPQKAQNTLLLERLPDATPHSSMTIIYQGPSYTGMSSDYFTKKGWTHTRNGMPGFGSFGTGTKHAFIFYLPNVSFYQECINRLNTVGGAYYDSTGLAKVFFEDYTLRNNQYFIVDQTDAGKKAIAVLAAFLVDTVYQSDQSPTGCEWVTIDCENMGSETGNYDGDRIDFLYYLHKAIIDVCDTRVITRLLPLLYDAGNLGVNVVYYQGTGTTVPAYYTSLKNPIFGVAQFPMSNNHVLAGLLQTYGGAVGQPGYHRYTYDDSTWYQKDANGAYILDSNGNPQERTDTFTTTLFGQTIPIYNDVDTYDSHRDSKWELTYTYSRLAALINNMRLLGGIDTLNPTNTKQTDWEKIKLMSWFRPSSESIIDPVIAGFPQGILNARPMNPDTIRLEGILMYIFCDVISAWENPTATVQTLGTTTTDLNTATGVWEHLTAGIQQGIDVGNFTKNCTWTLLLPRFPYFNQNTENNSDYKQHYSRKPIIVGGITSSFSGFGNKPGMWLVWCYPAQEVTDVRDLIVWVVSTDGTTAISPGYRYRFNGRKACSDYHQLPDACATATPSQFRFQFTDMLGNVHTQTGVPTDAEITPTPTPPTVQESFSPTVIDTTSPITPPITPPTTTSDLVISLISWNKSTGVLVATSSGALGSVTYRMVGVQDWSSSATFTLASYQITSGNIYYIEAKTATQTATTYAFNPSVASFTQPSGVNTPPITITSSTAQQLAFSVQNLYSPNTLLPDGTGKYDQVGLVEVQHEPSIDGRPPVVLPAWFPEFKQAGGDTFVISILIQDYELSKTSQGRLTQITNQLNYLRANNIPYYIQTCAGRSLDQLSDVMQTSELMQDATGTVRVNSTFALPKLSPLKTFITNGETDTTSCFYYIRRHLLWLANLVKADVISGLCKGINMTLGGRWEDAYLADFDASGILFGSDYSASTIADFKAVTGNTSSPIYDGVGVGLNAFVGTVGKAWYIYNEQCHLRFKQWQHDVIASVIVNPPLFINLGQYGGAGGQAPVLYTVNWPTLAQYSNTIKVNPGPFDNAYYTCDLAASIMGKPLMVETDTSWFQPATRSVSDGVSYIRQYMQAGATLIQFGQMLDRTNFDIIKNITATYKATFSQQNVPTINYTATAQVPASQLIAGSIDGQSQWNTAGGNTNTRVRVQIVNDLYS